MQNFKVGDKLICKCNDRCGVKLGEIVTIIKESDGYITYKSPEGEFGWDSQWVWPDDFELYKENNVELNKTDKYYIDVAKYAENNCISIQQASEEIQRWLFTQGYYWKEGGSTVTEENYNYLCLNSWSQGHITHTNHEDDVINRGKTEFCLNRKCNVELSLQIEEETIEFNGKRYSKSKLEQALKLIDESN